jgi:hypothetical protein
MSFNFTLRSRNKMKSRFIVVLSLCFVLLGCSTSVQEYKENTPSFNLFEYFEGDVLAWGMVQNFNGKLTRRFDVKIRGVVKGDLLTLKEDFTYDDGEKQQRIWKITRNKDGTYTGEADDVVGQATGVVAGNALNWQYSLRLPVDGSVYNIAFDDWMYRQDKTHVFNIAEMRKWGFSVGKVTLFFEKQDVVE